MLSPGDIKQIREQAWLHDHDWELNSCLAGEPFLFYPFLCYFDGIYVSICSFPLDASHDSDDLPERIQNLAAELLHRFHPLVIEVWGPRKTSLSPILPPSFHMVKENRADPHNINLQIDLKRYRFTRGSHLENARKAARIGYRCLQTQADPLTWQHFRLIEEFLDRPDLTPFDRSYTSVSPWIARWPSTRIFNVYKDDHLLGFKTMREVSPSLTISKSSYYTKQVKYVSDFLNYEIIQHYMNQKIKILDLGYSGHKKLLAYKRHWNPNIDNGSFVEQVYSYRSYKPNSPYAHWWARDIIYPALQYDPPETSPTERSPCE